MRRIIDNKRIEMTDDEWNLYQEICKSYDRTNFSGKELFRGLFETDENGLITFLRPPTNFTSMEVFLFMMSLFCHQHLRQMYLKVDQVCEEVGEKSKTLDELIEKAKKDLATK